MSRNISVKEAAEIMGKSQQFVRVGLQRGLLPIGTAVKLSSVWTYHISPKLFYEYIGEDKPCLTGTKESDYHEKKQEISTELSWKNTWEENLKVTK